MKRTNQIGVLFAVTALNFALNITQLQAAGRTWTGGGPDANWGTANNWGGTAPVNADTLTFSGANLQNNTNNISNLSVNFLRLANGGFTLNGNLLALNGPLTNSAGINFLALPINVVAGNTVWNIAAGSELDITGLFTNSTTANPLAIMGSGGILRITSGNCQVNRFFTLTNGTIIIDGGSVSTLDGFRLQPPTGTTAVFQITNNGSLTLASGANVRLCQTATGGTSRVDMSSGILNLAISSGPGAGDLFVGEAASTTTVFNQNGGLVEFTGNGNNRVAFANASASANGTYNLNGGTLWTAQIVQVTAGSPGGTFNFNGGTLKPVVASTTFFQGVQTANVQSGGAIIDTTNLNITIGQSLPGVGGLTKLGTGTLTLTGNNTYNGTTTVSNGTLVTTAASFLGGGAITVASNANLSVTFAGTPLAGSTFNLGSSVTNSVTITLGASPSTASPPAFSVTNLNGTGTALINIAGSGFGPGNYALIAYTNITGFSSFKLGSLPLGLSATLAQVGNVLSLNVALVPKNLEWSGSASSNWDTVAIDWFDLNNGNNPTNYAQSGGNGDMVTFDDNGGTNPNINLASTLTPSQLVFNNNAIIYDLAGAGKISGSVTLVKGGFQPLTIEMPNDFSGGTTLNAGTIYVGANQALGTGAATLNLGTIASSSAAPRTLPSPIIQNANTGVILGDTINTGTLTLSGGLNLGGASRTVDLNSDVIVSGPLTNGSIGTKTGPGTLFITGTATINAQSTQVAGNVVINGGQLLQTGDGWRMQNTAPGSTMDLAVTNGGSLTMSNLVGGNLRVGLAGEDISTSYILDVAGKVLVLAPGNPANVGCVFLGIGAQKSTLNLWPGGTLICGQVTSGGTSISEVDLYGGTLAPTFSSTTFFQGLTNAFVQNGGVIVDTSNLNITIAQPLLAAGSGGLSKAGTGTLTLTGANTYSGATIVNAGKLVLGPAHASPGNITVNANSTLAFLQSSPPNTVDVPQVTIGGGTNSALEAQLSVTNAPAGIITNLVLSGAIKVNASGSFGVGQFPLFGYVTITGGGGMTLGTVPLGTVGHLVTNTPNKTIDLVVSSIAQTLWVGATNGNWDTTTTNWSVLGSPVAYAQSANVLFNDTATNSSVNLTTALTPSTMAVSNNALNYTFSGAGTLGGNMTLVKDGTNNATIGTANSYTGTTTIKAGEVLLGNSTALGAATATVTVQNGATLDLAGNAPGLQPIVVGGNGVGGNGALINDTTDNNNSLRAVTLTSNTIIRADAFFGIRTAAETDLGFIGNGFKLTKTGGNQLNLNGGQANVSGLTVWDTDLGDVDIQQGTLSFQRRMTMGRVSNTVTVESGATLEVFTLNQAVMPLQTKPVQLNGSTFAGNGNSASEGSTFGGPITLGAGTNFLQARADTTLELLGPISGAGNLFENSTAAGTIKLGGTNTYSGNTVIQTGILALENNASIANTTNILVSAGTTFDVSALATSPWTLGATQTLGGSGTVTGSVLANGTLAPGSGTGTLTLNGNLTIAGNVKVSVNKSLAQSNDVANVSGTLNNTGTGTVTVQNLGPALAVNDKFTLFSQPVSGGGVMTVTGGGATWTNNLATDGSISVLTVLPTVNTNPVAISNMVSGGNLNLSWPSDHIGWHLQVQTNAVGHGLTTNWFTLTNSATTNLVSFPINPANGSVFFRLIYP